MRDKMAALIKQCVCVNSNLFSFPLCVPLSSLLVSSYRSLSISVFLTKGGYMQCSGVVCIQKTAVFSTKLQL